MIVTDRVYHDVRTGRRQRLSSSRDPTLIVTVVSPARSFAKTEVTGVNDTFGERSRGPFHTRPGPPLRDAHMKWVYIIIRTRQTVTLSWWSYSWESGSGSPLRPHPPNYIPAHESRSSPKYTSTSRAA